MVCRKSDWLIVLRGRESRPHGEAASKGWAVRGRHGLHAKGGHGPLSKERNHQP
jgi:hypothetical protein